MNSTTETPDRPSSELYGDLDLDLAEVFECMMTQRRHDPRSIRLVVLNRLVSPGQGNAGQLDESVALGEVVIQVVPTSLRVTYLEDVETPEYELEGWLLGDYGAKIWLRAAVYWTYSEGGKAYVASQAVFYRLRPGEEAGTDPSPGIK